MRIEREWIEIDENRRFETNAVHVKATIRFAVIVEIPGEAIADAPDEIAVAALLESARVQATEAIIENPAQFVRRQGEPIQLQHLRPNQFAPEQIK